MIDIVAAVNDSHVLRSNLLRSPIFKNRDVHFHQKWGFMSAAQAYNQALDSCHHDIAIFAHQDVYLPTGWEKRLFRAVHQLNDSDPTWAVMGIYGVSSYGKQVGWVWSSGLRRSFGEEFTDPVPVQSLDELLLIIKVSSGVRFDDDLPGFHLYGMDLVQSALHQNRGAYAICAPAIHNSCPVYYLGRDFFEAYRYIVKKWRLRLPVKTCVCIVTDKRVEFLKFRLRHLFNGMRYGHRDRKAVAKKYDIVSLASDLGFDRT